MIVDQYGNELENPDMSIGYVVDNTNTGELLIYYPYEGQEYIERKIRNNKAYLQETDYNLLKALESLILTMKDATALNFIPKFIEWLLAAVKEYGTIISKRQEWRDEINRLENEVSE